MAPTRGGTAEALDASSALRLVDADRRHAARVVKIGERLQSDKMRIAREPDWVRRAGDANRGTSEYNRFKDGLASSVAGSNWCPFNLSYRFTSRTDGCPTVVPVLVTKSGSLAAAVAAETDSVLMAIPRSPLAMALADAEPGETRVVETDRLIFEVTVGSCLAYEGIRPEARGIRIRHHGQRYAAATYAELVAAAAGPPAPVAEPAQTAAPPPPVPDPPEVYVPGAAADLDAITFRVDRAQVKGLKVPPGRVLLLDGPPGSGKTSVALMRIDVLLQAAATAARRATRPGRPDATPSLRLMDVLVVAPNERMAGYLQRQAESIALRSLRVVAIDVWVRRYARALRLPAVRSSAAGGVAAAQRAEAFEEAAAVLTEAARRSLRRHAVEMTRQEEPPEDAHTAAAAVLGWAADPAPSGTLQERAEPALLAAVAVRKEAALREAALRKPKGERVTPAEEEAIEREAEAPVASACDEVLGRLLKAALAPPSLVVELRAAARSAGVRSRKLLDGWVSDWDRKKPRLGDRDRELLLVVGQRLLQRRPGNTFLFSTGKAAARHLVVDEYQDLSSAAAEALRAAYAGGGTATYAGDFYQRLTGTVAVSKEELVGVPGAEVRDLPLNHRQTREVGGFVGGLYAELYGNACPWSVSGRLTGPVTRVLDLPGTPTGDATAVLGEVRVLLEGFGGLDARVAVICLNGAPAAALKKLERTLSAELLAAYRPLGDGLEADARNGPAVHVISVADAKGLEFDAVVLVDLKGEVRGNLRRLPLHRRNALYVATSRARGSLSLCVRGVCPALQRLQRAGLLVRATPAPAGG